MKKLLNILQLLLFSAIAPFGQGILCIYSIIIREYGAAICFLLMWIFYAILMYKIFIDKKSLENKLNILCFFGIHKWRRTTRSTSINGTIKEYFKCKVCNRKRKHQYNPNARHACCCGSGKEEGRCHCYIG